MTKTLEMPAATETSKAVPESAQKSMCVEFVQFCKEQHLEARAAQTFLHVLHNHRWEEECHRIREAIRFEVDPLFAPVEKAIAEGKECQTQLKELVRKLKSSR